MPSSFPILLVDDDPDLLDIIMLAAQTSFPEALFTQVFSYEQARAYIRNPTGNTPKLLLVDIDLGGQATGLDLLVYLKNIPQAHLLPVVMLTVNQDPLVVRQAYTTGASSYSVKPVRLADWQAYLATLKMYWAQTVKLPPYGYVR